MCFFFKSLELFNKSYHTLFEQRDTEEGEESSNEGDGFTEIYGWLYNAKSVSEFEGINLENTFDMGVMNFLNDLSYLKAKEANDKKLMRNARVTEFQ